VQAKLKAEEVKQAALEAERKATMEAKTKAAMEAGKRAEKDAIESSKKVTSGVAQDTESSLLNTETKESGMGFLFSLFNTF
jgi:phage-related protein